MKSFKISYCFIKAFCLKLFFLKKDTICVKVGRFKTDILTVSMSNTHFAFNRASPWTHREEVGFTASPEPQLNWTLLRLQLLPIVRNYKNSQHLNTYFDHWSKSSWCLLRNYKKRPNKLSTTKETHRGTVARRCSIKKAIGLQLYCKETPAQVSFAKLKKTSNL